MMRIAAKREWMPEELQEVLRTFDPKERTTPAQTMLAHGLALARIGKCSPEIVNRKQDVLPLIYIRLNPSGLVC